LPPQTEQLSLLPGLVRAADALAGSNQALRQELEALRRQGAQEPSAAMVKMRAQLNAARDSLAKEQVGADRAAAAAAAM
jgi:hypothetical protein